MFQELKDKSDIYLAYDEVDQPLNWCGGCGNFAIRRALIQALTLENIPPEKVILAYDVGCSGNGSDKIGARTIHGLHGRVIPLATGIKIARPELIVIASAGDGATLSEGINHLIHAVRRDRPILFIHHINSNFALTTGQPSASSMSDGVLPIDTMQLLLGANPSFFARTLSYDIEHMTDVFRAGLQHSGFAYVEVLQLCPTYNRTQTREWFLNNTVKVGKGYAPNRESFIDLLNVAKIPLGVLLREPRADKR